MTLQQSAQELKDLFIDGKSTHKPASWRRIAIVLSILWIFQIVFLTGIDYLLAKPFLPLGVAIKTMWLPAGVLLMCYHIKHRAKTAETNSAKQFTIGHVLLLMVFLSSFFAGVKYDVRSDIRISEQRRQLEAKLSAVAGKIGSVSIGSGTMVHVSGDFFGDDQLREIAIQTDFHKAPGSAPIEVVIVKSNGITDEGVKILADCPKLETLNLEAENVTDVSLDSLVKLRKLNRLILVNTKVTAEGCQRLSKQRPDMFISLDFGDQTQVFGPNG